MKRKLLFVGIVLALIVAVACLPERVAAAKLGSLEMEMTGGWEPDFIAVRLDGVIVGPQAFPDSMIPALWEGLVITPGDIGKTHSATRSTDVDFLAVAANLTNGLRDRVSISWTYIWQSKDPAGGGGISKPEDHFTILDPVGSNRVDFEGFAIDTIDLTVNNLELRGVSVNSDYSITVYGTPVPEPTPVLLLGLGLTGYISLRKRFVAD